MPSFLPQFPFATNPLLLFGLLLLAGLIGGELARRYARLADAYVTTPSAPAPRPSSARPASSCVHEPATAASTLPAENDAIALTYARTGPARSASCPAATDPTTLASMNALNAQP
jgi:hypothetical protein